MFKAMLCACLLAGAVFAHAQEKEQDPQKMKSYLALKKSFENLPVTLVTDPTKPLQIVWKDGSRIAELQLGTKLLKLDVPLAVSQNTCGNKATGTLCRVNFQSLQRGLRMVWKKHPQADRVGKPVKVGDTTFEALDFENFYPIQINPEDIGNSSLLNNNPTGEIMPMACKTSGFLPPATNGSRQIVSWAQDSTDKNDLSPDNLVQTSAELYDLELIEKESNRFHIKRPANPFFHVGANNDNEDDGSLIGDEGNIVTFKQGADLCRIQFKTAIDTSEILELYSSAPLKTSALTYSEFLKVLEVQKLSPTDPNLRVNKLRGDEYRSLMKYKDAGLADSVQLLAQLMLINQDSNNSVFFASNCRPDMDSVEYCTFKLKEMQ